MHELRAPAWDSGFPQHKIHGALRQRELMRQAVRHCHKRRLAVDVGAHIGLCSIALNEMFQRVCAFEPVAENYECLQANVPGEVLTVLAALGDRRSYSMRLPAGGNSGCWFAAESGEERTLTLDSFDLPDVDFIKLDVEGSEGFVLRGAVVTLVECRPVVLFEDNNLGPKLFGSEWVNPKAILERYGYKRVARLHKNEVWKC